MTRPGRVASLLALGFVLVQAAWVLAVPPFRGIDEFDHAYRAAAVAHGQLLPSDKPVRNGRGDYVLVPRPIVEAAHPVCSSYDYTGPDNCNAVGPADDELVEVASGAARYNPAFYWIIGKPSELFEGTANLYSLRALSALLCAALVWWAAYALCVGHRTTWPLLGLFVATTPVFVFSTSLGAPNGVEMCAGLALWASVLALRNRLLHSGQEQLLMVGAAISGAALSVPRLLGPGWLLLILAIALSCLGSSRLREIATAHRRLSVEVAAVLGAALAFALAWDRFAAPNSLAREEDLHLGDPVAGALTHLAEWVFQSVAAFPTRNEPAPAVVYATAFLALVIMLGAAGRGMGRRWWTVLGGMVATWLGVQIAITVATYPQLGSVWQGRYALPFAVGIPVLLAALAERSGRRPPHVFLTTTLLLLVLASHAVSIVDVYVDEAATSPLAGSAAWLHAPAWALVVLVLGTAALWSAAAHEGALTRTPPLQASVPAEPEGVRS